MCLSWKYHNSGKKQKLIQISKPESKSFLFWFQIGYDMAIVTFCAMIWGRVVTFLQYSRISTLSFLQVAFRSVSDSHLPKDHIHSHISTFIFTLYIFVLIYPCMLTPSCLNVRYIHLPARHLVFGAEKNFDLLFCLSPELERNLLWKSLLASSPFSGQSIATCNVLIYFWEHSNIY